MRRQYLTQACFRLSIGGIPLTSTILKSPKLHLHVPSWKGLLRLTQFSLLRAEVFQEWLPYIMNLSPLFDVFLY